MPNLKYLKLHPHMAKTKLVPEASHTCQIIGGSAIYKAIHKTLTNVGEKTIFPSKDTPVQKISTVLGGSPITKEIATDLINLVFGLASWKSSWLTSGLCFRDSQKPLSFGLIACKNEVKGLVMCVQAYFMKHLLFYSSNRIPDATVARLLHPTVEERYDVMVFALADIFSKVSGGIKPIVICIPQQEKSYYEQSVEISPDGVTEKLHLFEFNNVNDAQDFLRKYIHSFIENPGCGCLLFLYSLVLTKTFSSLRKDLGKRQDQLLTNYGRCSQALVSLILTGIATPFTHNGIVTENDDHCDETQRKIGAMERSEIGLLIWQQSDQCGSMIGSRLKTPRFPIWVIRIGSQYGMLFNPNRELTRDYRAENHFELHYYSSNRGQNDPIILSIDTRSERRRDDRDVPLLERLILTKWHGATVFWNGTAPFF